VAKRREAERLKTVRGTGDGPAPVDETKPWERVVSIFRYSNLTQDIDSANVFIYFTTV